jgi:hypothetical protein
MYDNDNSALNKIFKNNEKAQQSFINYYNLESIRPQYMTNIDSSNPNTFKQVIGSTEIIPNIKAPFCVLPQETYKNTNKFPALRQNRIDRIVVQLRLNNLGILIAERKKMKVVF